MSDLISRKVLLKELKKSREYHAETGRDLALLCRCENIVIEQPIACDLNKIVEELEIEILDNMDAGLQNYRAGLFTAIGILKRHGAV